MLNLRQGSCRVAIGTRASAQLFLAVALFLKHPLKNFKTDTNSAVKCLVDMPFLKEVSPKRFDFSLSMLHI